MVRQARRDTEAELSLRRELHALGLRYRVDRPPFAGVRWRADVVFGPARVAVFVDGCFWHGCPTHGVKPKNNREWWLEKLQKNQERDRRVDREVAEAGWVGIRVWEHEDMRTAAVRIAEVVHSRRMG